MGPLMGEPQGFEQVVNPGVIDYVVGLLEVGTHPFCGPDVTLNLVVTGLAGEQDVFELSSLLVG